MIQKIPRHVARVDRLDQHIQARPSGLIAQIGERFTIARAGGGIVAAGNTAHHMKPPHPGGFCIAHRSGDGLTKICLPVWQRCQTPVPDLPIPRRQVEQC